MDRALITLYETTMAIHNDQPTADEFGEPKEDRVISIIIDAHRVRQPLTPPGEPEPEPEYDWSITITGLGMYEYVQVRDEISQTKELIDDETIDLMLKAGDSIPELGEIEYLADQGETILTINDEHPAIDDAAPNDDDR